LAAADLDVSSECVSVGTGPDVHKVLACIEARLNFVAETSAISSVRCGIWRGGIGCMDGTNAEQEEDEVSGKATVDEAQLVFIIDREEP